MRKSLQKRGSPGLAPGASLGLCRAVPGTTCYSGKELADRHQELDAVFWSLLC